MDIETLKKQINNNDFKPIYFLYGNEDYLIQKTVDSIKKKVVSKDFESFNFQIFEGTNFTYNDFESAYEALPMMAEYKCVILKDINIDKLVKSDLDKFQALLKDYNPSTILIIHFINLKIDPKKSAKIKKICDIINKFGAVCEFLFPTPENMRKTISAYCTKNKTSIDRNAIDTLINQSAKGYSVIFKELDKLIAYTNGRNITNNDVKKLSIPSIESDSFELSKAILQNNYEKAFYILDKLFYLRLEPIMIMGALNMSFIDMYRIKTAQISGLSDRDVVRDFKYRSSYRITNIYSTVLRYSITQIRSLIKILEKADALLKSSQMDNRLIMEQMLGEMMDIASKRRMI